MDAFQRSFALMMVTLLSCVQIQAAPPDTNQPTGFRLTVELRDGSRIVGKSHDENFQFRSDTLGETKLPLKKIRSIESGSSSNLVKLTTVGGDLLTVEFTTKDIRVATVFGDVKLPINLIKSMKVTTIGQVIGPREGLIGLWSGEGNAIDAVSGNEGVLRNVDFINGVVGEAFSFGLNENAGGYAGVQVSDKPEYELTHSLSIQGWVRPRVYNGVIFIRGDRRPGLDPYLLFLERDGNLRFSVCDEENTRGIVQVPIELGAWIHVAATLDDATGTMCLYTNGVLAAQTTTGIRPLAALDPNQSPGIGIGDVHEGGGNDFQFIGDIDEIALYDRALSAPEVKAIYSANAANAGERTDIFPAHASPVVRRRQFDHGL
jgi:Concanavalin A-like lectin/glucanases superfamily